MPNENSIEPAPIFNRIGALKRWRKALAAQGKPCALVCGAFRLFHPGNLACIKKAAATGELCLIIVRDHEATAEDQAGLLALARGVAALAVFKKNDIPSALEALRPYRLSDCLAQASPDKWQQAARARAEKINAVSPLEGCWTNAIIKAAESRTAPLNFPAPEPPAKSHLDCCVQNGGPRSGLAANGLLELPQTLTNVLAGLKGEKIVTVNGCFDLLHAGHAELFSRARAKGEALIVLVNDDESVRALKGAGRPVFSIQHRLALIAALRPVTAALAFSGDNPLPLLALIRPAVHVKGGSFIEARVQSEKELIASWGGKLEFIPMVRNYSTSNVIAKLGKQP